MIAKENESQVEEAPGVAEAARGPGSARRALIGTALAGLAGTLLAGKPAEAHGDGPLASATISFGAWMLSPDGALLDRHPIADPIPLTHHGMCPTEVKIKVGGCVNFIIAGLHQILIYDDGKLPADVNTAIRIVPSGPAPPAELIADPVGLIYRGLDPTRVSRERVEVVHFPRPGTYLVICAIPRHFQDGMFGFITVLP